MPNDKLVAAAMSPLKIPVLSGRDLMDLVFYVEDGACAELSWTSGHDTATYCAELHGAGVTRSVDVFEAAADLEKTNADADPRHIRALESQGFRNTGTPLLSGRAESDRAKLSAETGIPLDGLGRGNAQVHAREPRSAGST